MAHTVWLAASKSGPAGVWQIISKFIFERNSYFEIHRQKIMSSKLLLHIRFGWQLWKLSLTFIDNISGISPTVIFGNKIQKFFLVTSDVTSDIWTVTSYVTDRSPVGVYVHGRLSCLWRHHCEIIKHKVEHQQKSGNVTGRVLRKQNPRPFGDVTERDLWKQNP